MSITFIYSNFIFSQLQEKQCHDLAHPKQDITVKSRFFNSYILDCGLDLSSRSIPYYGFPPKLYSIHISRNPYTPNIMGQLHFFGEDRLNKGRYDAHYEWDGDCPLPNTLSKVSQRLLLSEDGAN